jgi:hypothetical protein
MLPPPGSSTPTKLGPTASLDLQSRECNLMMSENFKGTAGPLDLSSASCQKGSNGDNKLTHTDGQPLGRRRKSMWW